MLIYSASRNPGREPFQGSSGLHSSGEKILLRYRVHFPQKSTFSGGVGNYLFVGKGIRREGVELADFLNPVVRPSVGRFNI